MLIILVMFQIFDGNNEEIMERKVTINVLVAFGKIIRFFMQILNFRKL